MNQLARGAAMHCTYMSVEDKLKREPASIMQCGLIDTVCT